MFPGPFRILKNNFFFFKCLITCSYLEIFCRPFDTVPAYNTRNGLSSSSSGCWFLRFAGMDDGYAYRFEYVTRDGTGACRRGNTGTARTHRRTGGSDREQCARGSRVTGNAVRADIVRVTARRALRARSSRRRWRRRRRRDGAHAGTLDDGAGRFGFAEW